MVNLTLPLQQTITTCNETIIRSIIKNEMAVYVNVYTYIGYIMVITLSMLVLGWFFFEQIMDKKVRANYEMLMMLWSVFCTALSLLIVLTKL